MSRENKPISERKKTYRKYLLSDHWKQLRSDVFARDGNKCRNCGSGSIIQAHHLIYRTPLESCTPNDLVTLCKTCHRIAHGLCVITEFERKIREVKACLNYSIVPSQELLAEMATQVVDEIDELEACGILRLYASTRIRSDRFNSWLAKAPAIKSKLWAWSKSKLKQLKKLK